MSLLNFGLTISVQQQVHLQETTIMDQLGAYCEMMPTWMESRHCQSLDLSSKNSRNSN